MVVVDAVLLTGVVGADVIVVFRKLIVNVAADVVDSFVVAVNEDLVMDGFVIFVVSIFGAFVSVVGTKVTVNGVTPMLVETLVVEVLPIVVV